MNQENVVFVYTGILFSHKDEILLFAGNGWNWGTFS
jgi:hypothetical protein